MGYFSNISNYKNREFKCNSYVSNGKLYHCDKNNTILTMTNDADDDGVVVRW